MGDNEPESQSLSLQVWETAQRARELSASFKKGSLGPGGQQGRRSPQSSRAEPQAADAQGDQCGAALWCVELGCLNGGLEPASVIPLKVLYPPFWVFSINVLASLMPTGEFAQEPMGGTWLFCLTRPLASMEFSQEPVYGWSRSADTAALTTCAGILSVSPCQMCLLWLWSFLSWTKVSWLTDSHFTWHVTPFGFIYFILS